MLTAYVYIEASKLVVVKANTFIFTTIHAIFGGEMRNLCRNVVNRVWGKYACANIALHRVQGIINVLVDQILYYTAGN